MTVLHVIESLFCQSEHVTNFVNQFSLASQFLTVKRLSVLKKFYQLNFCSFKIHLNIFLFNNHNRY